MCTQYLSRLLVPLAIFCLMPLSVTAEEPIAPLAKPSIIHKVHNATERLEMTVDTSRILEMDQKISQAQVNNPKVLALTVLSPTQIQISASERGVTQLNLWGEDKKIFSIDVLVLGDVRELQLILQTTFPNAALKVTPVASSVMISGFVDKPEYVERIIQIAEQYYPKVINNMAVGGCQQVLLHVKVMEVSRTKLRQFGFDWAQIIGSNVVTSGPSGLITDYNPENIIPMGGLPKTMKDGLDNTMPIGKGAFRNASPSTLAFNVVSGASGFFGVLEALRQDNLMKIMAEPTLVSINGQTASFNSGGEIPVPEPQSLGTISIKWKPVGTLIKFVPIVLGNGKIRLDVRSEVSELDETRGYNIAGTQVPAIKMRDVQTTVEMMAGQTLAIAGLVQTRVESENAGLPWISEVPYLGAAFRSVKERRNEIELLIMVTPELVEAMDADEVPQCGPGTRTTSPSDWELFMKGHLEVPNCSPMGGSGGGLPPEGMILGPVEQIPTPAPADASGHPGRPYNRHAPPKPNSSQEAVPAESLSGPPGLIGPVGYDVVE